MGTPQVLPCISIWNVAHDHLGHTIALEELQEVLALQKSKLTSRDFETRIRGLPTPGQKRH